MGEEEEKVKLVGEEVEVLTICYQKPGSAENLAKEMGKEIIEIEAVLKSLAKKKLVKEEQGSWETTSLGDFYIENDKGPEE